MWLYTSKHRSSVLHCPDTLVFASSPSDVLPSFRVPHSDGVLL